MRITVSKVSGLMSLKSSAFRLKSATCSKCPTVRFNCSACCNTTGEKSVPQYWSQ
ncbi:hypothetical protein THIOM_005036 [Candidatus Thiomargarita nelsonii]|uniref:Uncharacterized protein n=1 Tax=Candidatus Thiomargarita nelsonii TaxID=1003181 RepID=A0A176RUC2_9GAMM|nr:hypothetical protein THIOM_005036 [Candidatus Thiomargarita nelsonii]